MARFCFYAVALGLSDGAVANLAALQQMQQQSSMQALLGGVLVLMCNSSEGSAGVLRGGWQCGLKFTQLVYFRSSAQQLWLCSNAYFSVLLLVKSCECVGGHQGLQLWPATGWEGRDFHQQHASVLFDPRINSCAPRINSYASEVGAPAGCDEK